MTKGVLIDRNDYKNVMNKASVAITSSKTP